MNDTQDLATPLVGSEAGSTSRNDVASKRAQQIATQDGQRKALGSRLCALGVFLRLLTLANGFGLLGCVAYLAWLNGYFLSPLLPPPPPQTDSLHATDAQTHSTLVAVNLPSWFTVQLLRDCLEYLIPACCGVFLVALECSTAAAEASTRRALGFVFGASGRLMMLLSIALVSAPLLDWEHSTLQMLVSTGAVGGTALNGLLQGWILACVPNYRKYCVAELCTPRTMRDVSGFPQIYQRDEGPNLHLGVLLPGFSAREHLTMTVNASELELVGEIKQLEAPFTSVDSGNSLAGPFGPFQRTVQLSHPVDTSTPVESEMKHGIIEYRFLKGYSTLAEVA